MLEYAKKLGDIGFQESHSKREDEEIIKKATETNQKIMNRRRDLKTRECPKCKRFLDYDEFE